jgi:hypothetical protein
MVQNLHNEGLECPLSQTVNYYQCAAILTQKLKKGTQDLLAHVEG